MKGILFAIAVIFMVIKLILWIVKQANKGAFDKPAQNTATAPAQQPEPKQAPPPPPQPKYEACPIEVGNYERYVITTGISLDFAKAKIQDFGELPGKADQNLDFGFADIEDWLVFRIPSNILHPTYHNLLSWMDFFDGDGERADEFFGIAINLADSENDYVFSTHNNYQDSVVGIFRNGKHFLLSLPDSYGEPDQVHTSNDPLLEEADMNTYLEDRGFDFSWLTDGEYAFTPISIPFHSEV